MPGRRKLRKEIYGTDFDKIERLAHQLHNALSHASIGMSHYTPHGQAMMKLHTDLRIAVNALGNRPPDYHRHNGHMSPEEVAWHREIEAKARASLKEELDNADDEQSEQSYELAKMGARSCHSSVSL